MSDILNKQDRELNREPTYFNVKGKRSHFSVNFCRYYQEILNFVTHSSLKTCWNNMTHFLACFRLSTRNISEKCPSLSDQVEVVRNFHFRELITITNHDRSILACFRLSTRNISKKCPKLSDHVEIVRNCLFRELRIAAKQNGHFLACFRLSTRNLSKKCSSYEIALL